ncbi:prostatic acid phosphatase-like [Uranotaenia lowii]|uniref:prostatic acid phosphatase-like n=1 Tax=Uranotaenia lowii TaxID=190385 RepID=UPI0024787208|nr:prostatic acid phosphatase-like [Uranotaenia lowii]
MHFSSSAIAAVIAFSVVFALISNAVGHQSSSLKAAFVVFRHGGRSPVGTFPSDLYRNYSWIGGYGALQPKGTEQSFLLGRNLRSRYRSLLPLDGFYWTQNLYATSSSVERCVMTVQAVLAAFLKPQEDSINIPIWWQPATITTIPTSEDIILQQSRSCPKFSQEFGRILQNPPAEFKPISDECAGEYDYLTKQSGMTVNSWQTSILIYDALEGEFNAGLRLPDWTKRVFPEKAKKCYGAFLRYFTATPILKKLRGGATFTEILKVMKSKQAKTLNPDRSLFFYSGHDLTQVSLLDSMGMLSQTTDRPDFASAVVFELHENKLLTDGLEVRIVYYKNWTVKTPQLLTIPGCSAPCSLTKLEQSMKAIVLDNYDTACAV